MSQRHFGTTFRKLLKRWQKKNCLTLQGGQRVTIRWSARYTSLFLRHLTAGQLIRESVIHFPSPVEVAQIEPLTTTSETPPAVFGGRLSRDRLRQRRTRAVRLCCMSPKSSACRFRWIMDAVAHLTAPFLGPLSLAILIVAVIFMALICFALQKKDRVRTGFWLRSFGFFLEAEGGDRRSNPRSRKA
jgi:hypothetical protein